MTDTLIHRPTKPTVQDVDLLSSTGLAAIGEAVAIDGIRRSEEALARVASRARQLGVSRPVVDLLTDATAPDVVRARALARISAMLVAIESARGAEAAA